MHCHTNYVHGRSTYLSSCLRMLSELQKVCLLSSMLEHKCALLQKLNSASDGKKAKIEIWGKIFRKMEANGYNGSMRKLRDTEYQNIRKTTMKKRDKSSVRNCPDI